VLVDARVEGETRCVVRQVACEALVDLERDLRERLPRPAVPKQSRDGHARASRKRANGEPRRLVAVVVAGVFRIVWVLSGVVTVATEGSRELVLDVRQRHTFDVLVVVRRKLGFAERDLGSGRPRRELL